MPLHPGCTNRELYDLRASTQRAVSVSKWVDHATTTPTPMPLPMPMPVPMAGQSALPLFNPDDPAFSVNLAGNKSYAAVEAKLFEMLQKAFTQS